MKTSPNASIPKVLLFLVKDVKTKLDRIAIIAQHHFSKQEHLLIAAADGAAQQFVDDLLWNRPEDSFLPHSTSQEECDDLIVITTSRKNLNNARYVLNLCPTPLFLPGNVKIIYELEDHTAPNKHLLSQKRIEAYKDAKYPIESK